jgi:hypothetical protein
VQLWRPWLPGGPRLRAHSPTVSPGQRDPRLPVGAPGYALGAGRKDSSGYRRSRDLCRHGTRSWSQAATLSNLLNLQKAILGEGVIAYPLFRAELESSRRRYSFSTAADDCDLIVDPVDDHLWERERPAWQSSIWSARHGSDHSDRVPRSAGQHDNRFPEPTTGSEA